MRNSAFSTMSSSRLISLIPLLICVALYTRAALNYLNWKIKWSHFFNTFSNRCSIFHFISYIIHILAQKLTMLFTVWPTHGFFLTMKHLRIRIQDLGQKCEVTGSYQNNNPLSHGNCLQLYFLYICRLTTTCARKINQAVFHPESFSLLKLKNSPPSSFFCYFLFTWGFTSGFV
jgi:hypothetical protein